MNMSINFDVQSHLSWFKHEDLIHANAEKEKNLGCIP